MSQQITVRLSNAAAQHLDQQIEAGTFDSRAAYLTWLVEREADREGAYQELMRLRRAGVSASDAESEAIAKATSTRHLSHLD